MVGHGKGRNTFLGHGQRRARIQNGVFSAGFDQSHEPANELSQEVRSFAHVIMSMIEEADAINRYEQRMAVAKDHEAKLIMQNAQQEEMCHFSDDHWYRSAGVR